MYIRYEENQQPPNQFLSFNNQTKTLIFRPNSIWFQGQTYYFSIVVKEKNSDTMMYPHYCTVKIEGEIIDPFEYLNFTDLEYRMTPVNRNSTGTLIWNNPVNLTFVKENWDTMFDVYIQNVTKREHNSSMRLANFEFTRLEDDGMTMHY